MAQAIDVVKTTSYYIGVKVNNSKSGILVLTKSKKSMKSSLNLSYDGISYLDRYKYLGTIISFNVSAKFHI